MYRRRDRDRCGPKGPRGQSLVEFALIAPITILLLLAVIDIGGLLSTKNSVAYASRQAARLMEAYGNTSPDPSNPNASPDTYILNAITDTLRGSGMNLNNLRKVVFYKGPAQNQNSSTNTPWTGDDVTADCVYTFTNGLAGSGVGAYCPGPTTREDNEYAAVAITYHYPGITPFYRTGVNFTDITNIQIEPRSSGGVSGVLPTPVVPPPPPATWTPTPTPDNAATFVKSDTATQGSWVGKYGHDGNIISDEPPALPSYA